MIHLTSKNIFPSFKNGIRNGGLKINESKSVPYTFTIRKKICLYLFSSIKTLYLLRNAFAIPIGITINQRLIPRSPHLRNKLLSLNYRFGLLRSLLTSHHIKLLTKLLIYKLCLKRTESNYEAPLQNQQISTVFSVSSP